jgi:hypothetical protein
MNTAMVQAPMVVAAYGGNRDELERRRDQQCRMGHTGDAWNISIRGSVPRHLLRQETINLECYRLNHQFANDINLSNLNSVFDEKVSDCQRI